MTAENEATATCQAMVNPLADYRRCKNVARENCATCHVHADEEDGFEARS